MADRAVSAVLGYVLTLAVMGLLVGGLFLAAGDFVGGQHERAIRAELEVVGNRVAADLAAVDRLALAAGDASEAELRSDLPERAAGSAYRIELAAAPGTGEYFLNASTSDPAVTVSVRVRLDTPLATGTVDSGDVLVTFNGTALEVHDA